MGLFMICWGESSIVGDDTQQESSFGSAEGDEIIIYFRFYSIFAYVFHDSYEYMIIVYLCKLQSIKKSNSNFWLDSFCSNDGKLIV